LVLCQDWHDGANGELSDTTMPGRGEGGSLWASVGEEDNEWMSGLAHKRSKGRTCLVRHWRKVHVDNDIAV